MFFLLYILISSVWLKYPGETPCRSQFQALCVAFLYTADVMHTSDQVDFFIRGSSSSSATTSTTNGRSSRPDYKD